LGDKISKIVDYYHHVQQDVLETFVDRGQLRKLAEPTVLPTESGSRASTSITLDSWQSCTLWYDFATSPPAASSPRSISTAPL
jgi:hypothetical protein